MQNDCCFPPNASTNWNDWASSQPQNIADLVAIATLNSTVGTITKSTTFATPGTWVANAIVISSAPTCVALGTDNLQKVADAGMWNFQNKTANLTATTAPPLQSVLFLRPGTDWEMDIPLDLGVTTYTELQLGFLDNAGTRGDAQGTIPVIDWTGSFTSVKTLKVTLNMVPGTYNIGLWAKNGSSYSMFAMRWIVVADQQQLPISLGDLKVQSFITGSTNGATNVATPAASTECFKSLLNCDPFGR
jgi:hypothetical protein